MLALCDLIVESTWIAAVDLSSDFYMIPSAVEHILIDGLFVLHIPMRDLLLPHEIVVLAIQQ